MIQSSSLNLFARDLHFLNLIKTLHIKKVNNGVYYLLRCLGTKCVQLAEFVRYNIWLELVLSEDIIFGLG